MNKYTILVLLAILFITNLNAASNDKLPTLQEAWVDTGFFTWNDSTKTSLHITEFGAKQVTLPDVCDGEQLTSASFMFSDYKEEGVLLFDDYIMLKRLPKFNTSNITNFSRMFHFCDRLESIPSMDTSKGTDFSFMFNYCALLEHVELFDTSRGTDFRYMFMGCAHLTDIPLFDTSKGESFEGMFMDCNDLQTVPLLDTSKGKYFGSMFTSCLRIKEIPPFDTRQGTDFALMFYDCRSLEKKPHLVISKDANTEYMYDNTRFHE